MGLRWVRETMYGFGVYGVYSDPEVRTVRVCSYFVGRWPALTLRMEDDTV